jgi:hypothetical protein
VGIAGKVGMKAAHPVNQTKGVGGRKDPFGNRSLECEGTWDHFDEVRDHRECVVVFHSRSNAKEVHFIHYKLTYKMYTRTGYKRRDIREEYRRNPEEYTIHQHHGINNINIKEEIWTMVAVQGADSGGRRGRRTSRRRGLDPEQDGSWKYWKKEGVSFVYETHHL